MIMRGIERLNRSIKRIRNRLYPTAIILAYHRVVDPDQDPQLLCVSRKHFSQHLQVLRKDYHPLRLGKLVKCIRNGQVPGKGVVVTFDDGYLDNLQFAKPLLANYDIPGTVFVTAGNIGNRYEFWWDELERLLLLPGDLPTSFEFKSDDLAFRWELQDDTTYTENDYKRYRRWNISGTDTPTLRHGLYRKLCEILHPLPQEKQGKIMGALRRWAGMKGHGRDTHRSLSTDEVAQLGKNGNIEIGSHSFSHSVFSTMAEAEQTVEIEKSKSRLEDILGKPVRSFSYPYGYRNAYTKHTIDAVQKAGFTSACSNFPDMIWKKTDCYQLPRLLVRDWDGETFSKWLSRQV